MGRWTQPLGLSELVLRDSRPWGQEEEATLSGEQVEPGQEECARGSGVTVCGSQRL
jgi:hypothetical protein